MLSAGVTPNLGFRGSELAGPIARQLSLSYGGIGGVRGSNGRKPEVWVLISSIVVIQLSDGFVGHYPRFEPCGEFD